MDLRDPRFVSEKKVDSVFSFQSLNKVRNISRQVNFFVILIKWLYLSLQEFWRPTSNKKKHKSLVPPL